MIDKFVAFGELDHPVQDHKTTPEGVMEHLEMLAGRGMFLVDQCHPKGMGKIPAQPFPPPVASQVSPSEMRLPRFTSTTWI